MLDSSESRWDDGPYGVITLMDLFEVWDWNLALSSFNQTRSTIRHKAKSDPGGCVAIISEDLVDNLNNLIKQCQAGGLPAVENLIGWVSYKLGSNDKPTDMTFSQLESHMDDIG